MSFGLHGVREAARKDSRLRFTALLHHINEDCLREAFFSAFIVPERMRS